jgi:hypothetical protein
MKKRGDFQQTRTATPPEIERRRRVERPSETSGKPSVHACALVLIRSILGRGLGRTLGARSGGALARGLGARQRLAGSRTARGRGALRRSLSARHRGALRGRLGASNRGALRGCLGATHRSALRGRLGAGSRAARGLATGHALARSLGARHGLTRNWGALSGSVGLMSQARDAHRHKQNRTGHRDVLGIGEVFGRRLDRVGKQTFP